MPDEGKDKFWSEMTEEERRNLILRLIDVASMALGVEVEAKVIEAAKSQEMNVLWNYLDVLILGVALTPAARAVIGDFLRDGEPHTQQLTRIITTRCPMILDEKFRLPLAKQMLDQFNAAKEAIDEMRERGQADESDFIELGEPLENFKRGQG